MTLPELLRRKWSAASVLLALLGERREREGGREGGRAGIPLQYFSSMTLPELLRRK